MTNSTQPINPFTTDESAQAGDKHLVVEALAGNHAALEKLITRHQPWIYNLAFRMVMVHDDAEDVTQEVLIKVITKLAGYDSSKGAFRTWLYRIVVNHVINMKSRGYEAAISELDSYYSFVTQIPDQEPDGSPETQLVIDDLSIGCVMGVLLCLERTQRLVFLLAIGFNVTDAMGAEILDMSRDAFRKNLSRARARLREYMTGNCGLVDPNAPCRCRKKAPAFIASGAYSVDRISFHRPDSPSLRQLVGDTVQSYGTEIFDEYVQLFREHPFYTTPDISTWLRDLIARPSFREIWQLDGADEVKA
ncbi:MAG: RNA polymerase sigma factor [bacterium]|nr:RNA polymerase sigma factor [bacterium]